MLDEANFVTSINAPSGITLAGGNTFTGSANELRDLPVQQQVDWLADEGSVSFIKNKPAIADVAQADWDAPEGSPGINFAQA